MQNQKTVPAQITTVFKGSGNPPNQPVPPPPPALPTKLTRAGTFFALVLFIFWLILFVGGITVDTRPYRCAISPEGVKAMERESRLSSQDKVISEPEPCIEPNFNGADKWYGMVAIWLVVLLMFLPLNLALVCATAGVLGIMGNIANLSDDKTARPPQDNTNPYISAMLRGFFVYLFLISGLLLLDTNPFSNPTPGQYIRLAGFLSIFSFVVNYQPSIFSTIIVWAFDRIEKVEIQPTPPHTVKDTLAVEISKTHTEPAKPENPEKPPSPTTDEQSRKDVEDKT